MNIISKLFGYIIEKQCDRIMEAGQNGNTDGTVDEVDRIVNDYLYLIRKTYKGGQIQKITLTEDPVLICINGEEYNFDALLQNNNQRQTDCKREIGTLMDEDLREEVERWLNNQFV